MSAITEMLKAHGVRFDGGLTEQEFTKIEQIYGVSFPKSLRDFYSEGVPTSDDTNAFPRWRDFSDENIAAIKSRITEPYEWLRDDVVKNGFWLPIWGERSVTSEAAGLLYDAVIKTAPVLIPVYSHRYIPATDGINDPPVISTVGCDTIYYGSGLENYLHREFMPEGYKLPLGDCATIPFWSDIINAD